MKPCALASALLLWATLGQTEPMHFNLTGNGGNCEGCGWLAADGEITAESAKQMTDYLRTLGFPDWRGNVLFNSPGGNFFGEFVSVKVFEIVVCQRKLAKARPMGMGLKRSRRVSARRRAYLHFLAASIALRETAN